MSFVSLQSLDEALKYCNYVFTIVFVIEAVLKLVAFGFRRFFKDRWNQLDLAIVLLSIMGITLEEIEMNAALPINPTIIRIMRVLRIARVLKLLKMATGMRALLDTVVQALPQVGNLGLLFMLLFFIYAALGVELFGKLDCSEDNPCEGLSRHATFNNFGMAFLTLFRVSTGDNWNGIMKDTLRECHRDDKHCLSYLPFISPVYFVTFVLIAQFVLVNVVVAVLMKHLEESNKEAKEDAEMDAEIELEMSRGASTPVRGPESRPVTPRMGSPLLVKHPALDVVPGLGEPQNLLTVRKISVARMHSLPNDSYMFRPVMPAKAPFPLHEAELEAFSYKSPRGSITSIHSQPVGTCSSSLRVPRDNFHPMTPPPHHEGIPWKLHPPQPPPLSPSVHRLLCRQEAIQRDSLEGQGTDSKESTQTDPVEPRRLKKPSQSSLGPPLLHPSPSLSLPGSPPLPHASPHRSASLRTRKHAFGQHNLPGDDARNPNGSLFESSDLADEEVSHINSSAEGWRDRADGKDRSESPPPSAVPVKNGSTSSLTTAGGAKEKDLKKFYSVDPRGFLAKPAWSDDHHRRHSIEICPSIADGERSFSEAAPLSEERKPAHSESEYIHGARRKKKMSPPCISIEPPMEEEKNTSARTKASENSLLRRRTPSCESTAYRDPSEAGESQTGDPGAKAERRGGPACRGELLAVPNFSFEAADGPVSSGVSEAVSSEGPASESSPDDGVSLEPQKAEHSKTEARRHGLVPATDGEVDEPV
uniref:Ion transport domain-containing protein n=1 Tax=Anolis carolinensis TaxID=28377 RepID=H9GDW1_ANOCA